VFIQTVQFKADGTAVKPGSLQASFAYRDADLTPTMWAVDYTNGEKDPYYNGDDAGLDGGVQGNATTTPAVNATMGDTPDWPDVLFPAGAKKVEETFVTASFSAAGADSGTFYDWIDWTYAHEKGKTGKITLGKGGTGTPGTDFTDSVSLWASHHKFVLPKVAAAPAPAPVPSPAPGPVPAPPPAAPPKK
jgi:hypothetical protein